VIPAVLAYSYWLTNFPILVYITKNDLKKQEKVDFFTIGCDWLGNKDFTSAKNRFENGVVDGALCNPGTASSSFAGNWNR
jgi:hypothetical protein